MDTRAVGDVAEAAVLHAFARVGLSVWLPWSRFGCADLIVENGAGRIVRVQVKSGRVRDGCVVANGRSTDHGSGRRSYLGRVEVVAVHVPALEQQFVVPVEEIPGYDIRLRLVEPLNNQRVGVRFAADFLLDDWAQGFAGALPVGVAVAR